MICILERWREFRLLLQPRCACVQQPRQ